MLRRTCLAPLLAFALVAPTAGTARQLARSAPAPSYAIGPQYDTTHVYVAADDFDRLVASLLATFGGTTTKNGQFTVTPTPSITPSQLVLIPVGTISVFGLKTPVPYPFGAKRTGHLLSDFDSGLAAARAARGDIMVEPFPNPIDCDAVVQRVDV